MRDFAAASFASIFLHPLHFAEARLVLQNRLPNFQSYKSLWTMFMSSYKEMYKGITAHIPRNFLLALSKWHPTNYPLNSWLQLLLISEHLHIPGIESLLPHSCLPGIDHSEAARMPDSLSCWYATFEIPRNNPLSGPNVEGRGVQRTLQRVHCLSLRGKISFNSLI